jgi:hypothetical protein
MVRNGLKPSEGEADPPQPFPVGGGMSLEVPEQIALEGPSEDPQKRRAGGGRNG